MPRLLFIVILAWFVSWGFYAYAHDWYPASCCSETDCAPIRVENVKPVPGGYAVFVPQDEHPQVHQTSFQTVVPYDKMRPSPDGDYHICLRPEGVAGERVLCFFGPPMGS